MGVNELRIKTAQFYEFENGNSHMPNNGKYSRYKLNKHGKYVLKNKLYNHCWRMWSSAVVTVNAEVVPCCFDKDAINKIGNLKTEKLPILIGLNWPNLSLLCSRTTRLKRWFWNGVAPFCLLQWFWLNVRINLLQRFRFFQPIQR